MHPIIHLFGLSLPAYGIMALLGLAAAYAFLFWQRPKFGVPKDDLFYLSLFGIIGVLIGAKFLYLISILPVILPHLDLLIQSPARILPLLQNGFVFYGGLLGAIGMIAIYCHKYHLSKDTVFGLIIPAFPLFHAFGRVGCFLAGCCFGIESSWGIAFSNSIAAPNGIPLFPVQLLEAVCNFLLFILLFHLSYRLRGKILWVYLISYSILRFGLEFLRNDEYRGIFHLSISQWLSLLLLAFCGGYFLGQYCIRKRQ